MSTLAVFRHFLSACLTWLSSFISGPDSTIEQPSFDWQPSKNIRDVDEMRALLSPDASMMSAFFAIGMMCSTLNLRQLPTMKFLSIRFVEGQIIVCVCRAIIDIILG